MRHRTAPSFNTPSPTLTDVFEIDDEDDEDGGLGYSDKEVIDGDGAKHNISCISDCLS